MRRHSQRTVRSLLPLFTGYLFFCGHEDQRVEVLQTNRVANLIDVIDQDSLLSELSQIDVALQAGVPLIPQTFVKIGQWCRVKAGPLMGLEGIVQTVKNVTRLILQVQMLGQAAFVEIDSDMIEPIDEPSSPASGAP
ncbi:transcription termination/antitermination protein NusG [Planctomycetota bacterium]